MAPHSGDKIGGIFWSIAGLFSLFLLAQDMVTGVGWTYYSGYLLFLGLPMLIFGLILVRRA